MCHGGAAIGSAVTTGGLPWVVSRAGLTQNTQRKSADSKPSFIEGDLSMVYIEAINFMVQVSSDLLIKIRYQDPSFAIKIQVSSDSSSKSADLEPIEGTVEYLTERNFFRG